MSAVFTKQKNTALSNQSVFLFWEDVMGKTKELLSEVFKEREGFIIIGLTGRTGSGCSTVTEQLIKETTDFKLPEPSNSRDINNEDRKYRIIYDFIIQKKWKPFTRLQVTDIITSLSLRKQSI